MNKARNGHVGVLAAGVGHFERRPVGFFDARDHLSTNRALWILGFDEIEKMRRNRKREFVSGQDHPGAFLGGWRDFLFELLQVGQQVFKLPFPVVPELGSDIGPETWGEGKRDAYRRFRLNCA